MKTDKFKIIQCNGYCTIVNEFGEYEDHCHTKTIKTAKMLVKLMRKRRVPKSKYLRESAKRVTLNKRYIEDINVKIEKDKNRQYYFNPSKGVRN